ncbi:hypothetical protein PkoCFBP13504_20780 [Pseudomonas koreensis]|uniref:hypothetical protein n=1 Tax=Pseudomonas koreensis TaxID=198620 RepID=UPI0010BFEEA2|nr:hypothetical protein [Pseudomonas koreensis]TKJ79218.1 hypothetical protein PkoCFBP13504_20780 [Pseudomonas koreensis]
MNIKKNAFSVSMVLSVFSIFMVFFFRELGVEKNVEYKMTTEIYVDSDSTLLGGKFIRNVETMAFGHRSFQYASTWQKNGAAEYLYVMGRITPIWGEYAYMVVEKQVVTDGLASLLAELDVPIILDRQLQLSEGSTSYIRLVKNDSSGMCFYHYDNNSLFCFGLR